MSKKELKDWLLDKLNCCYRITSDNYPGAIFWMYDKRYVRKIKMCEIEKLESSEPIKIKGVCLFEQDTYAKCFYCEYTEIWKIFQTNYSTHWTSIKILIKNILKDNPNLCEYSVDVINGLELDDFEPNAKRYYE